MIAGNLYALAEQERGSDSYGTSRCNFIHATARHRTTYRCCQVQE